MIFSLHLRNYEQKQIYSIWFKKSAKTCSYHIVEENGSFPSKMKKSIIYSFIFPIQYHVDNLVSTMNGNLRYTDNKWRNNTVYIHRCHYCLCRKAQRIKNKIFLELISMTSRSNGIELITFLPTNNEQWEIEIKFK